MSEREREPWDEEHRKQTITVREVGGWVFIAVALWRFHSWPEAGPSQWDAVSTLMILAFGAAGALPRAATIFASYLVDLSPWGKNK